MTKKVIKTFSNETKQIYDVNFTNEISTFNEILKKIDAIGELPVSRKSTQDYLTVLETQKNHIASVYANIFQGITDSANSLSKVYDDVKTASNGITNLNGCLKGDSTVQSFTLNKREYLSTKILDPNQLDAVTKFKFAKLGFTNKQLNNLQTLGYDLSSLYGEIVSTDSKNKKKYNKQDIKQMQSLADEDYDSAFNMDHKKCSEAMKLFITNYTIKVFQYDKKQCQLDSNRNIKLPKTQKLMQSLVLEEPNEDKVAAPASNYTGSNKCRYLNTICASLGNLLDVSNATLYSGNVGDNEAYKLIKEADEISSLYSLTQGLQYSIIYNDNADVINKSKVEYNRYAFKNGINIKNLAYDQDERTTLYDMRYNMGLLTPLDGKMIYKDYSNLHNEFEHCETFLMTSQTDKIGSEYEEQMQAIQKEKDEMLDKAFIKLLVSTSSYVPYVGNVMGLLAPDDDMDGFKAVEKGTKIFDEYAKTNYASKVKNAGKIIKTIDKLRTSKDRFLEKAKKVKDETLYNLLGSKYKVQLGSISYSYNEGCDDPATNYVLGKINKNGIKGLMEEKRNSYIDGDPEQAPYTKLLDDTMIDYNPDIKDGEKYKELWFGQSGTNKDFDILKMDPNITTEAFAHEFHTQNAPDDQIKSLINDEVAKYREKETW